MSEYINIDDVGTRADLDGYLESRSRPGHAYCGISCRREAPRVLRAAARLGLALPADFVPAMDKLIGAYLDSPETRDYAAAREDYARSRASATRPGPPPSPTGPPRPRCRRTGPRRPPAIPISGGPRRPGPSGSPSCYAPRGRRRP